MVKHPKRPKDVTQLGVQIMRELTGQDPKPPPYEPSEMARRGRLGGLKGGKARKKALPAKRRTEIAKKAAEARWKSKN